MTAAVTLDDLHTEITYNEEIAPKFADFLRYAWQESAENFAADLATHGATPDSLRLMAMRWRDSEFEPLDYATALELFATQLERMAA